MADSVRRALRTILDPPYIAHTRRIITTALSTQFVSVDEHMKTHHLRRQQTEMMTILEQDIPSRLGSDDDQSERRRNIEQVSTHNYSNTVDCNVVDRCKKKHKYIRLPIVNIVIFSNFVNHQRHGK